MFSLWMGGVRNIGEQKLNNFLYSEIFYGGQKVHKYLYSKTLCTSRGSLDVLEAIGINFVGQAGEGRLKSEKRFGTFQYYYTVDPYCTATRSNIITL